MTHGPKQPTTAPRLGGHLKSLTSLRFFGALAVFIAHTGALGRLSDAGRSGVSFFFVLSGFVLAWSATRDDSPKRFWRHRAARIIPAYLVAWLIGIAISFQAAGSASAYHFADTIPGFVFLQAWFTDPAVYFAADGPGWSLSCEALFYLLFPLIYRSIAHRRNGLIWTTIVMAVIVAAVVPLATRSPDPNYYWSYILPPLRLTEFVIGVSFGVLVRRGWRSPIPLAPAVVLTAIAFLVAGAAPKWASAVLITLVPYLVLITSAASFDLAGRCSPLHWSWMVRLGVWSYSFYLVHELVLGELQIHALPGHLYIVGGFVLSLIAAALLCELVERPMNDLLRGPATRRAPVDLEPDAEAA
jgi:peptidoglycan/LPS O-acetylase OafA/YrhL